MACFISFWHSALADMRVIVVVPLSSIIFDRPLYLEILSFKRHSPYRVSRVAHGVDNP